ncbi:MAG: tRNA pseudouridine(55) synthase TruB, partial [Lachnospiraceae bacterium]|nr:tRNA pseudouridine(55) synthase TruB [Lachnospiraceae bacterium]
HQKKIGHTGTLDPAAVGVLPVCCGKATKVCELLTDKDKSYRAVCKLGIETDTQDTTGTVLQEFDISGITEEDIIRCVSKFEGDIMQVPPMYSALKVNGKKLYELAREGKTVERKARPVTISEIKVSDIDIENGTFTMDVTCSKGTYIRTLCHDIGKELGIAAAMQQLTRTRVSVFEIENAYRLSDIQKLADESIDKVQEITMQVDALFDNYRSLHIKQEYASYLANGNTLSEKMFRENDILPKINEKFLIYDENNLFKAIYKKNKYEFKVEKMF